MLSSQTQQFLSRWRQNWACKELPSTNDQETGQGGPQVVLDNPGLSCRLCSGFWVGDCSGTLGTWVDWYIPWAMFLYLPSHWKMDQFFYLKTPVLWWLMLEDCESMSTTSSKSAWASKIVIPNTKPNQKGISSCMDLKLSFLNSQLITTCNENFVFSKGVSLGEAKYSEH